MGNSTSTIYVEGRMGSGLKKAGVVLLTAGSLLTIVFFILGIMFTMADREHKVLDESDFSLSGCR
ncbi:MAG: hypothetical protein U9R75_02270 [Candidatus Thermoplasmatota archaeon]|nr:hypothetical protein [Candidatus Thermoplasmatota archaeon]